MTVNFRFVLNKENFFRQLVGFSLFVKTLSQSIFQCRHKLLIRGLIVRTSSLGRGGEEKKLLGRGESEYVLKSWRARMGAIAGRADRSKVGQRPARLVNNLLQLQGLRCGDTSELTG